MAVSSVSVLSPFNQQPLPLGILRPHIEAEFEGGTPNYDVLWEWDDDPTFGNANGRRVQETDTGLTTAGTYTKQPSSDLAAADGRTFHVRVTVTDNSGGGTPVSDSDAREYVYFATNPQPRSHLHLSADITTAFDPTDEVATLPSDWGESIGGTQAADGHVRDFRRLLELAADITTAFDPTDEVATLPSDWGESIGGTQAADGHVRDFRRLLELAADVTVAFSPKDEVPALGPDWGESIGGTEGADGFNIDFDRFLLLQSNVTTDQPCPFLFSSSKTVAEAGDSVTLSGQGLVSATSPTADAWGAEVRLYELPDLGSSYTVLPIIDYTAGDTLDTITVSVPGGATSGVLAVVHTAGSPTCAGSNFLGLTVVALAADSKAGWWVEIWDQRNTAPIIRPLIDAHEAVIEVVPDDEGRGHLMIPANHPDLQDIVDRQASPPVQNLVKVYQHGRFSYAFVPDDYDVQWADDGARLARVYGAGQESQLRWGRILWKDYPAQPSQTRTWLYGSTDNAAGWGSMDPSSVIQNGGLETADLDPFEKFGDAGLWVGTEQARSGAYALRVTTTALNDDGVQVPVSVRAGQTTYADLWVKNAAGGSKTFEAQLLDEEDNVVATDTVVVATTSWVPLNLEWEPVTGQSATLRIIQTAGTVGAFWVDDVAAYVAPEQTFDATRATYGLSRDYVAGGLHSLQINAEAGGDSSFNGIVAYFPVQPGQDYRVAIPVSGPAGAQVRASLRLGGTVDAGTQLLTGLGTFDVITLEGTAGPAETTARMAIASLEASALTFYVDEITAYPGRPAASPGLMVLEVLGAIQARGSLTWVQADFTSSTDSAGQPWPYQEQLEIQPEWSLYDLLEQLVGMGYHFGYAPINWRAGGDTGWVLSVYGPSTQGINWDAEPDGPVILPGAEIADAKPSNAPPASTVIYGEGAGGVWTVTAADAPTISALERREDFIRNTAAADTVTLFNLISHKLKVAATRGASFTADITDAGDPLPWYHFLPADQLRAHLPTVKGEADHVPEDVYRVAAATARLTASGRYMQYAVDFGSYRLHAERLRDLILRRMVKRQPTELYQPGAGRVGHTGGGSSSPSSQVLEEVPAHEHAWPDIQPAGLGGDLFGVMPAPTVAGIRSIPVTTATPANGQALTYQSGQIVWGAGGGGGGGGGGLIAQQILGSSAAHLEVGSIPGGSSGLKIVLVLRSDVASQHEGFHIRVGNGSVDAGANYDWTRTFDGTSEGANQAAGGTAMEFDGAAGNNADAGAYGVAEVLIPDYDSTSREKFALFQATVRRASGQHFTMNGWARWANSSDPITVVRVLPAAGSNWLAGSLIQVYAL